MNKPERLPEMKVDREATAAADLLEVINGSVEGDEQTRVDMIEGETSLFEAIDAALDAIQDAEITEIGCDDAMHRLTARKTRAKNRKGVLRAAIEQAMARLEINSLKRPTATLSLSTRAGAAVIDDEASVPAKFWKAQKPKLDKAAVTSALKDGEDVPGARMGNGNLVLTIGRK